MSADEVEQSCPYKIPLHTRAGCCTWETFISDFAEKWLRWFSAPPTAHQWSMARRDWKSGNTGYEAAHNANRRMENANTPAAREDRETKALTRSLIAVARAKGTGRP